MQQSVALITPPYCYQVIKQSLVHIICRQLGTASAQVQTHKSGLRSKIGLFRRHKGLKIPEFLNLKQKRAKLKHLPLKIKVFLEISGGREIKFSGGREIQSRGGREIRLLNIRIASLAYIEVGTRACPNQLFRGA